MTPGKISVVDPDPYWILIQELCESGSIGIHVFGSTTLVRYGIMLSRDEVVRRL